MKKPITIGLVQMSMSTDMANNLAKAEAGIQKAAKQGAEIICLPELFRSLYFCVHEKCSQDYSEELPGQVGHAISKLAKDLSVTIIAGSIYEKQKKAKYNSALVYDSNGTHLGTYRKTHIPHDPAFYEQHYFQSGGSNYQVFETNIKGQSVKFGVLICYDQWFPEAARSLALLGAEIIFYPTAIATIDGVYEAEGNWQHAWTTVQKGHAVANATVVAAINRVGKEGNSNFWGGSFVCDAFGRLKTIGSNQEEILIATVDLNHNQVVKDGWRFFKERRPDTYNLLTSDKN